MFFHLAALPLLAALVGCAQAAPLLLPRAQSASTVTVTSVLISAITETATVTVTETSVLLQAPTAAAATATVTSVLVQAPTATETAASAIDTDDLSEDQKIALQIAETPQDEFPDVSDFAS
ncbi:hypothetical protein MVEN_00673500 [Mycena venus]|uniref:Uncharacterized protein n=1 Tax=Mycena venus TaxID=2733690 RepID=A0A8H7D8C2_9AGAR|nr:hypothetical protein MVEN_00673500 [Mycena venus]